MAYFITRKALSRRTLLRGVGAALALPLLDSMAPAMSAAPAVRSRFGAIYFPHGATMARWTPKDEGSDFTFSEILQPLEPFRNHINVISNLAHAQAYGPGGATGNHNRSSATFLSGAKAASGAQPRLGVTVDQVAVKTLGQDTPLPSLELMTEDSSMSCGEGLSCAYRNTVSWQSDISPLPMQNNPQVLFEQLFGDGADAAQRAARRAQSLSLLDSVAEQLKGLNRTLPAADRARLDRFATDVREIERRITQAGERSEGNVAIPARPNGIPDDLEQHIKLMYDLMALAWQAEITRISTFLMAKELSNAVYPKSGVRDSFHILSHHSNNEDNKARFAVLNRYHVGLLAYFLGKLAAVPDGDGTLLDHSLVLYGSGMSDGNSHNHDPLPLVLAGHAGGTLSANRHLVQAAKTPMSNLLLALLDKLGCQEEHFGDSTGRVEI
ncbi:MAG: DUF1552 domain-containing protein [Nevskiaceae bacterium]|jgi:hypothetical protein|nr:DUF1552 domain-containing protein [Nevskiaceae bacterium]